MSNQVPWLTMACEDCGREVRSHSHAAVGQRCFSCYGVIRKGSALQQIAANAAKPPANHPSPSSVPAPWPHLQGYRKGK